MVIVRSDDGVCWLIGCLVDELSQLLVGWLVGWMDG